MCRRSYGTYSVLFVCCCIILVPSFAKVSQRVSELDVHTRVDASVVANVDKRTFGQTNGRKTGSLYRAMPQAGATIIYIRTLWRVFVNWWKNPKT